MHLYKGLLHTQCSCGSGLVGHRVPHVGSLAGGKGAWAEGRCTGGSIWTASADMGSQEKRRAGFAEEGHSGMMVDQIFYGSTLQATLECGLYSGIGNALKALSRGVTG